MRLVVAFYLIVRHDLELRLGWVIREKQVDLTTLFACDKRDAYFRLLCVMLVRRLQRI